MTNFNIVKGIEVQNLEGIHEGYSINNTHEKAVITINISAEKINTLFLELCTLIKDSSFLIIEIPTHQKHEQDLRKNGSDPFHKDIYYLDGIEFSEFKQLYEQYMELFIHDGLINFGFGNNTDEVFIGDYKIMYIHTNDINKFEDILKKFNYKKEDNIKVVMNNFTPQTPGRVNMLTHNNIDIYQMIEQLKSKGLYMAKRVSQ
jgi:hypothetical protein